MALSKWIGVGFLALLLTSGIFFVDIALAGKGGSKNVSGVVPPVFFVARDFKSGYELWVTDGTTLETHRVMDFHEGSGR